MNKRLECIDAGSEYCPCYLAETGDCITCSILRGKDFCDCNWRGSCIYSEFVWNNHTKKDGRKIYSSKIVEKKLLSNEVYLLKIETTKTLARQLKQIGSYIFIRGKDMPHFFDVPMSVMESNEKEGYIYILYKTLGSKTKNLNLSDKILIRGPYWNGIYGLKNIKKLQNNNCLLIARGVAQSPTLLLINKIIKNNSVTLILDKGKLEDNLILEYLKEKDIEIFFLDTMKYEGKEKIKEILINKNIDFVFSAGSDVLHKNIIEIIDKINSNIKIAATNNSEMCCGEGVCGSCSTHLDEYGSVKGCKTQIDIRKLIKRRVNID
ncbi:sulfide/dihydroorotate dehydrogenase-like FAD/NAD-binding protein [Clostridium sp. D2Q-14]|uniref:sulfide/dihydroorotate dehydrogenase-like FAD/NAD-binding protein n=1 Tax=Anaeromonas gelatinilytica TaxID=2683194 RepID=UPI00193C0DCC|nr:sulfide/dihydroorotate dehydrogenase-like FAD/NAD-binding protein [Anaeromonas gelatinilytica]MBS4536239.1 sulfide/dihydroorotate dehydrogenase-like FAD/NAD-binding protein [Anaeromonas gelatinilytica]